MHFLVNSYVRVRQKIRIPCRHYVKSTSFIAALRLDLQDRLTQNPYRDPAQKPSETMNDYAQIYLIDDFEMTNLFHKVLFTKLEIGAEINVFTNPVKALDDLRQKLVVSSRIFVLLDLNMPEMSGFEFLETMVKEHFPEQVDVVIATSSICERDMKKAEQYPQYVRGFVTKPLKMDRLKSLLNPLPKVNLIE